MDERVIPYGFPEIPGGASGGASIDPTPPTPEPGQVEPYDLSNLKVVMKDILDNCETVGNVHVGKTALGNVYALHLEFSGIVPVDLVSVNSIKVVFKAADFSVTAAGTDVSSWFGSKTDGTATKTIIEFQDGLVVSNSSNFTITSSNWDSYLRNKQVVAEFAITIDVYDLNGDVVQTKSVVATL